MLNRARPLFPHLQGLLERGPLTSPVSCLCTQTHHWLVPEPPLGPTHSHVHSSQIPGSTFCHPQDMLLLSTEVSSLPFSNGDCIVLL